MNETFHQRLRDLREDHEHVIEKRNDPEGLSAGGVLDRYHNPVLTANHVPLEWRYDLNSESNPWLMERLGINSVMNAGAIKWKGKYLLIARVEGVNRKSFFAIAESTSGIDGFRFWKTPVVMPAAHPLETNLYDMRVTAHEDGWIYGLFCAERKDPGAPESDQSSAIAQCGIARTKDFKHWERLPDLETPSPQQRNVVLHPEFIEGSYAFYTRPQAGFIGAGEGGGIGFGLASSMEHPVIRSETIVDPRVYHTVYELKNGQGPAPLKTSAGWLNLAHGVRATAAGLRYVLYLFLTDLRDPRKVIARPGGYLMAPTGAERVGDVSNVLFCNGWIADDDGKVFIYYASSDSRMHVATSSVDKLLDYALHTPADGLLSSASVQCILELVENNLKLSGSSVK